MEGFLDTGVNNGNVDIPYLVTLLIRKPIFVWYVVWYGFKYKCQKDTCLKEIVHYMFKI